MDFLTSLRNGELGARIAWPSDLDVEDQFASGASLLDERFHIRWHVEMSRYALDLQPTNDDVLRSDAECFIQSAFETSTPRTRESNWSPIVDFLCSFIDATRVLKCVYRTAYEAHNEIVVGEVLIPLSRGTMRVSAYARATVTGVRETAISTQKISEGESPESASRLPQHEIDDPSLDDEFPTSPLSRVRRALAWRIDDAGFEITEPYKRVSVEADLNLPRAGCTVTPPPRYAYCPDIAEQMSLGLDCLTRVAPPGFTTRMVDVWRLDAAPISGWNRRRKLWSLAVETTKRWHRQGASGLEILSIADSEYQRRPQLDLKARFVAHDTPIQIVQRWFLDDTGQPIRVNAGGPTTMPIDELSADVNQVALSWRPN